MLVAADSGLWHNSLHHTACQSTSVSELPRDTGVWEHYLVLSSLTHQKASGSWAKAMKHISPRCFHSCMLTSLLAQSLISTQIVLYNLTTKLHTKNVICLTTVLKFNAPFCGPNIIKFILTFYPIDKAIFSFKLHLAQTVISEKSIPNSCQLKALLSAISESANSNVPLQFWSEQLHLPPKVFPPIPPF